jgi:ketosteroid isomerase-like protein
MSSLRDLAEQGFQLYNAGDVEGLVNLYTEDATLVTPWGTFEGRAAIHEAWRRDKAAFPDGTLTLDVLVEQGDTLGDEWTIVGTHTGPLVMPDGTELPPTGKQIELKGMELVQLRGGKIAVHRLYWDNMAVAGQLGVLPGAAT